MKYNMMNNVVNIFMCVRNNETTLQNTLNKLNEIEFTNLEYKFRFYIYENDSVDNTKNIIVNFYNNHKGNCIFETLNNQMWSNTKDTQRVIDMSKYRNKMKNLCKNYKNSNYSIILDTNINFNTSIFKNMVNIMEKNEKIHMITPFGFVEGKCKTYYDSFALKIESTFKGSEIKKLNYELKKTNLVKLKSGFAGFIMIRTETLKRCEWKYSSICSEHNYFCNEISEYGDIVCAGNIKVSWKK